MKLILASLAAAVVATGSPVDNFFAWQKEHSVSYTDADELALRQQQWLTNDKLIAAHNAREEHGLETFRLAHNQFSAMSSEEFKSTMLNPALKQSRTKSGEKFQGVRDVSALPADIDWVTKGAVTAVKNQGNCGSCWAFSTTGSMEGALFTEFGTLTSLSEQQLVGCDRVNGPQGPQDGCNGGYMDAAYDWIGTNGGLCSEADYPYTSGGGDSGTCKKTCSVVGNTKVMNHTDVAKSDAAMMSALAQQPVSIAIEADQSSFQFYSSGVMTATCGSDLDHGVLAVGYGTDKTGGDYYKVKNSWAASWGEKGYIRLGRGTSKYGADGQCGMLLNAAFPRVAAAAPTPVPPPTAPTPAPPTCKVDPKDRQPCSPYETTEDKCEAAGCCWDTSVPTALWCFLPPQEAEVVNVVAPKDATATEGCCEPQQYKCCTKDSDCCTDWGQLQCSVGVCVFPGANQAEELATA